MNIEEMPFWSWWVLACILVVAEMMTTTFTFMFFALSAVLVGVAQMLGLRNMTVELVLFGVLGLVLLAAFRKALMTRFKSPESSWNRGSDIAHVVKLLSSIPAHGEGQTEYQGTIWGVRNESNVALAQGQEVVIVKTEGVKLVVRAKN